MSLPYRRQPALAQLPFTYSVCNPFVYRPALKVFLQAVTHYRSTTTLITSTKTYQSLLHLLAIRSWRPPSTEPNNRRRITRNMKITILSLVLALGALAATVPAVRIVPEPIARDTPTPDGTIDCSFCTGMLDFCFVVSEHTNQVCCDCCTECVKEWSFPRSGRL